MSYPAIALGSILFGSGLVVGALGAMGGMGAAFSVCDYPDPDMQDQCYAQARARSESSAAAIQVAIYLVLLGFILISAGVALVCRSENRAAGALANQPVNREFDLALDEILANRRANRERTVDV